MGGIFEELSGAKGIRKEGKTAQRISDRNALVEEQRAIGEERKAAFAQKRQAKKGVEVQSALEAKLAAAGGTGSPVAGDLVGAQAEELELENLLLGFEGQVLADQRREQAVLDRLTGQAAKQRSKNLARKANVDFGVQLGLLAIGGFNAAKGPPGLPPGQAGIPNFGTFA